MIGTFGGALEARKINASNGRLRAEVRGEIESDQGVLVIRRVHLHYLLDGVEQVRKIVERVHRVYADKCPVYRTLRLLNLQGQPRRKVLNDSSAKAGSL